MTPDISVIIPTWNRAALLPATLDAILDQTLPAREIIVVDDGSTDATVAMLKRRYAGRVRVLRMANGGDLVARNAGLAIAGGDLVAFCDSDDLWHPDFLARMAALWEVEPSTRVAFADFLTLRDGRLGATSKFSDAPPDFWEGLRLVGPGGLGVFDAPILERVIRFQPFFPSCMVADRRFLIGIGGWDASVGRLVGTDFATLLLLAEHAPFGVVHQPLVTIRKHAGNYSADVQAMNLGDAAILEHVLARRASLSPWADLIEESVARRRAQALDLAFVRQDHLAVRGIYQLLPRECRPWPVWLKAQVAALPGPLRGVVARGLLALGSWRAARGARVAPPCRGGDGVLPPAAR